MPELCRVGVCGFDPMLVKGYVTTGFRGLWWHISDEIYEKYNVKPNDKISGTLHKVYKGAAKLADAGVTHEPNVPFEWNNKTLFPRALKPLLLKIGGRAISVLS